MNEEIRDITIQIAVMHEELFRMQQQIKALEGKKKALQEQYKKQHPTLYKGWDVV